jgi:hypothetical protein
MVELLLLAVLQAPLPMNDKSADAVLQNPFTTDD